MSLLRHVTRTEGPDRVDLLADPALEEGDVQQVLESLLGRIPRGRLLDGDRSVVLPARGHTTWGGIKIKGAGFQGGRVKLGSRHDKPYPLPRYDAEGAATLDAAKDHGRAFAGGMSYQQARHEFTTCRYLRDRGVRIFPSLGYGALHRGAYTSWFCVLDWPANDVKDWWRLPWEPATVTRIAAAFGETQRALAQLDVYMLLTGLVAHGDTLLRKDFHTAHIAGPGDSFLTRLAYFLFDTNFVLAQFGTRYGKASAELPVRARIAYLRALTGVEHAVPAIDRFKKVLVELKYADWEMDRRIGRLAADPIGRLLLEEFLAGSGEAPLFGVLPAVDAAAGPGDADAPAPPIAVPRGLAWLRRLPWPRRNR